MMHSKSEQLKPDRLVRSFDGKRTYCLYTNGRWSEVSEGEPDKFGYRHKIVAKGPRDAALQN